MMKRNWILTLLMIISLILQMHAGLAEGFVAVEPPPVVQVDPEYADELQQAIAALEANSPGAVVDYAVRERDDGRYEWNLFFTLDGRLGQCEIREEGFEVRRVVFYDMPTDGLTAAEAMAVLAQEKGDITIVDLELDYDDGCLCYEGEASLGEKLYEFEINADGRVVEWERD